MPHNSGPTSCQNEIFKTRSRHYRDIILYSETELDMTETEDFFMFISHEPFPECITNDHPYRP